MGRMHLVRLLQEFVLLTVLPTIAAILLSCKNSNAFNLLHQLIPLWMGARLHGYAMYWTSLAWWGSLVVSHGGILENIIQGTTTYRQCVLYDPFTDLSCRQDAFSLVKLTFLNVVKIAIGWNNCPGIARGNQHLPVSPIMGVTIWIGYIVVLASVKIAMEVTN